VPVNPVQHSGASIIIILLRNFEKRGELGGRPRRTSSCPGDGLWHLRCCTVRSKHFSQTSFSSSFFSSSHPFPPASPFLPRPLHLAGALLSIPGSVSGISFSPFHPLLSQSLDPCSVRAISTQRPGPHDSRFARHPRCRRVGPVSWVATEDRSHAVAR